MHRLVALVAFFMFPFIGFSQASSKATAVQMYADQATASLKLDFDVSYSDHLLVLVSDSEGTTVFMDSKSRFKGRYTTTIDLQTAAKGKFELQVICDSEKQKKNFTMN